LGETHPGDFAGAGVDSTGDEFPAKMEEPVAGSPPPAQRLKSARETLKQKEGKPLGPQQTGVSRGGRASPPKSSLRIVAPNSTDQDDS
jgi:hypothetical protein